MMKRGQELLYLSRSDVELVGLSMAEIMVVLEETFAEKAEGKVEMPPKPGIHTRKDAFIHAMPAWVPKFEAAGLKWVGGYPENQKIGLPYISGLLLLNCPETGLPLAVMDCTWITAMRTGAVTGLAAKYLASPASEVVAVLGCGVQGRTNLEALLLGCPSIKKVLAYDLYPEISRQYALEMEKKFNIQVLTVDSPEKAVSGSDIVVTAGPILKNPVPTIEASWFKEGALAAPVDFDSYWKPEALHLAEKLYVDDIGQFEYYKEIGYFKDMPPVAGELGEIVSGKITGRGKETDRIVTMNLGLAMSDMVTAVKIYEKAVSSGSGVVLPL